METALLSKNLIAKPDRRANLKKRERSLVLNENKIKTNNTQIYQALDDSQKQFVDEKQPNNLLDKIEKNLVNTREFIKKMEKCKETTAKNPKKVLQTMDKFLKDNEDLQNKSDIGKLDDKNNNNEIDFYFKSLNKIEDTIKFLETNLNEKKEEDIFKHSNFNLNHQLDEIDNDNQENNLNCSSSLPQISTFVSPDNKTSFQKMHDFSTLNKEIQTFMLSPDLHFSTISKKQDETSSKKKLDRSTLKNEEYLKSPIKNNDENAPISFDITARSKDNEEKTLDNLKDSFLLQSILKNSEIQLNPINPDLFFRNIDNTEEDSDKENMDFNSMKPKKDIQIISKPKNVDEEDDMMEKIKEMLENTRNELNKMNEKSFDFPNYQVIGKENKEVFFENPKNKSFLTCTTEKSINMEPNVKYLNDNFQAKVTLKRNTMIGERNLDEDELPMPRNYNIIKAEDGPKNKVQGKNNNSNSLNIRSFLK